MSWPVQIIPPGDKIPSIKWKRWFYFFICFLMVMIVAWGSVKIIAPAEEHNFSKTFTMLFFIWLFVYSVILSIRTYYYGVCLSAYEAREQEAMLTRQGWTEWASRKFYVPAYKLFLPSVISQSDIATSHFVEIYSEQQLKLRGHNGDAYTEEQLIYELLASVRAQLINLKKTCVFDVIFTYGSGYATFSTFKECWTAIGFSDDCLGNCFYWNDILEPEFDSLSNIEAGRVSIIISANIESIERYCSDSTEFASILLVAHREILAKNESGGVALRTMACDKDSMKQEVIQMMTYQPDVFKSSKVLFSNMSVNDALDVSEVLRTLSLSMDIKWEYETQHLNLILGKLSDTHFWLVFALALFISETNNEPVLIVASVGDDYVFNVIGPFDNSREL
ncbi:MULTISPECIES: hypothetical protein [Enterobacterales]|uniref:hypothetical protein n=1 Tax=Enterobacterales TaxID=91347 RepID=UPI002EDAA54D